MKKYILIFILFYLQVFLYSFSAQGLHRPELTPEDLIAYKSFCIDEDAILRVGIALEESKQKSYVVFFNLSVDDRCFHHPVRVVGLVVEEIYSFKKFLGTIATAYKIKVNPEETVYVLYLSEPHLGV